MLNTVSKDKLYAFGNSNAGTGLYKITIEEYFQSKSETNKKRFHNLKYIEKVADVPADALASNTRSGGSTMGSSTTKYNISDLFALVKQYDKEFNPKSVNEALINADGTPKIAAPISINGKISNVAVVVKITGKNRYKTHRILLPDGSEFIFGENKNSEPTYSDMLALNGDQGTDISSESNNSISKLNRKVNSKFSIPADPSTREESRAEKARRWLELGEKYGTIPEGENAADDYNVPKKVTPNRKVKRFVSNLSQNITPHREAVMLTLCGVVIDFYSNPSLSSLYISSVASLVLATISPPSRGKQ